MQQCRQICLHHIPLRGAPGTAPVHNRRRGGVLAARIDQAARRRACLFALRIFPTDFENLRAAIGASVFRLVFEQAQMPCEINQSAALVGELEAHSAHVAGILAAAIDEIIDSHLDKCHRLISCELGEIISLSSLPALASAAAGFALYNSTAPISRDDGPDIAVGTHEHPITGCQSVGVAHIAAIVEDIASRTSVWMCSIRRDVTTSRSAS